MASVLLNSGAGTPTLFNFSSFVSQFNLELLKFKLIFLCPLCSPLASVQGTRAVPWFSAPTISSSLEEEEDEGGRLRRKVRVEG